MMVFATPSPHDGALYLRVAQDMDIEAHLVQAAFDTALNQVRDLMARGEVEAVVCRWGTARLLRSVLRVPVAEVEIGDGDVLRALVLARAHGRRVGVLWYGDADYVPDFDFLGSILDIEVMPLFYREERDVQVVMHEARRLGCTSVTLGDASRQSLSESLGLPLTPLQVTRPAVVSALLRCKYLLELQQQSQEAAAWLRSALHAAGEGLVAFDSAGNLMLMNTAAERILEVTETRAQAQLAGQTPGDRLTRLRGLVLGGEQREDILFTLGRYQVLANTHPIMVQGRHIGTLVTFHEVARVQEMEGRIRRELQAKGLIARYSFADIIGESPAIRQAVATARQCAEFDYTVLLEGETGTGKELIAQSIHNASSRAGGPFVVINCSAMPETLLESELFGYEEGAFTGARRGGKPGLFELAHAGTLFLDEVARMPLPLQARLLRVLQERQVMRLGGERVIPVDIRIIAATNCGLWAAVQAGEFREDLFYRLNVLKVEIPPLRDRPGDLDLLLEYSELSLSKEGMKRQLSPSARARFSRYSWPGNVRELQNAVLACLLMGEDRFRLNGEGAVTNGDAAGIPGAKGGPQAARPSDGEVVVPLGPWQQIQEAVIHAVLEREGGNRMAAARRLGVSPVTLWRWQRRGEAL